MCGTLLAEEALGQVPLETFSGCEWIVGLGIWAGSWLITRTPPLTLSFDLVPSHVPVLLFLSPGEGPELQAHPVFLG